MTAILISSSAIGMEIPFSSVIQALQAIPLTSKKVETRLSGFLLLASTPRPTFADIDNDGDVDAFVSFDNGKTLFFRNTAAPGSTTPAYARQEGTTPFGIPELDSSWFGVSPALADIDDDGDLDLFLGDHDSGKTLFFRNNAATPVAPVGTTTADGSYSIGSVINITIIFSEDVVVDTTGGTPTLQLKPAAPIATPLTPPVQAATHSLSNTPFKTVTPPQISIRSPQQLSYSTAAPSPMPLAIQPSSPLRLQAQPGSLAANADLVIDTVAPTVTGVDNLSANGTYAIGDVINLTVAFIEAVVVDTTGGTPTLQLETGSTDRYAAYLSGSGSNTLTFQYTVQAGDSSTHLDQLSSTALALNGGFIKDAAGNSATLTLADPGETGSLGANADLVIKGVAPTITGVDSTTTEGTYAAGSVINITINVSEDVVVDTTSGIPPSNSETGSSDRYATYTSGSGSNTLTFQYTVQAGDTSSDLDQFSSTALVLNGGSINDAAGNPVILTLAAPAETGSLSANADLVIDAARPTGSLGGFATAPAYIREGGETHFGIADVGSGARPILADLDEDGDLDFLIGNDSGNTLFFRNTAAPGAYDPAFEREGGDEPFGIPDVGNNASPALADIDGDGDLDLFIGESYGNTFFFRNTAAPGAYHPAFEQG